MTVMRRTAGLAALLLGWTLVAAPLWAAIYAYRDERGHLYLTDSPPNSKYRIVVTTRKDRAAMDTPEGNAGGVVYRFEPQKVLLPNDEAYGDIINSAAQREGIDPYLIKAVCRVESDFDPNVVSSKGAMGLMQLIPGTAALVGCRDAFDPQQNIFGGARYLRMMLDRFQGNVDFALAGYNAGPGKVEAHRGIPPIRETQNYVKKVNYYYRAFRGGQPVGETRWVKKVRSMPTRPTDLSRRLVAAYTLFQQGDTNGAVRAYQDILAIYPNSTPALYNFACLLDQDHRYEEAVETYQKALAQDPFMDKALYNLAIIFERLGQHQQAISTWRRFITATKDEDKIVAAERYIKELQEYAALQP